MKGALALGIVVCSVLALGGCEGVGGIREVVVSPSADRSAAFSPVFEVVRPREGHDTTGGRHGCCLARGE